MWKRVSAVRVQGDVGVPGKFVVDEVCQDSQLKGTHPMTVTGTTVFIQPAWQVLLP